MNASNPDTNGSPLRKNSGSLLACDEFSEARYHHSDLTAAESPEPLQLSSGTCMDASTQLKNPFPRIPVCRYGEGQITALVHSIQVATGALYDYLAAYDEQHLAIGVRGRHGSGKTHLLSYLARKMRERREDATCLYARNDADVSELYKQLIRQISKDHLLRLVDVSTRSAAATDEDKANSLFSVRQFVDSTVRDAFQSLSNSLAAEAAYKWLIGDPVPDYAELDVSRQLSSLRLLGALHRSAGVPLLILIDGLEASLQVGRDAMYRSISTLKSLIESLTAESAFLVIAGIDEAWDSTPEDFVNRLKLLQVGNLDLSETKVLLESYANGETGLSQENLVAIQERSAGRPRDILRIAFELFEMHFGDLHVATPQSVSQAATYSNGTVEFPDAVTSTVGVPVPPVAGYVSDSVPNDRVLSDELGIGEDVSTLCSILLAKEVQPPLAVGLFGDWGTGKSYFMEAMYRYIEDLAKRSASAEHTAYYGSVVQIRFNAWHYVDANLWASLVSHIFDELAEKVCPQERPEETKKRLLQELDSARQIREEATKEKQLAESRKRTAEQVLNSAITERKKKEIELADLHPSDLLQLIAPGDREKLKTELVGTLDALGLPPLVNSLSELDDAYRQAFSLGGRIQAILLSFRSTKNPLFIVALVVLMFVAVPLASWVFAHVLKAPWLVGINATFGELAVALGGLVVGLKKHLSVASHWLADLEAKRDAALKLIRRKQDQVSQVELRLQAELETLRAGEEIAQKRVEEADSQVVEIQRKLDDIESGRSLSKFIMDRVQAEDYRKYLGIVSTIRKDFERLGNLLEDGRAGLDKIGRLILYIDDLDRCPADKVVEVLQAVHLLLAMPLFVVVVGVDLRWLLHSLEDQYTAFRNVRGKQATSVRPEWVTSPLNYLEKIFQIPFSLRPMEIRGYQKLMRTLLRETAPAQGTHPQTEQVKPNIGVAPVGVLDAQVLQQASSIETALKERTMESGEHAPVVADNTTVERTKTPDLNPASLQIQSWERDFAEALFAFVPTPRAAKRFVNVYRLLKAPLSGDALRDFEGTEQQPGHFQAAMLLLGVALGLPQQAEKLFTAVVSAGNVATPWPRVFAENLTLNATQSKAMSNIRLQGALSPFRHWAARVARFTFEAAKSALSAQSQVAMPTADMPELK